MFVYFWCIVHFSTLNLVAERDMCLEEMKEKRNANNIIVLHVWGFLGNVTWALSRNNAWYIVRCNATIQTEGLLAALLRTWQDTEMFLWSRYRCLQTSIDFVVSSCLEIAECRRVCVWLWIPAGWKTELILGNCERSTCVWKLPDCKNESLCPKNVETGHAHVFGDFLTARMWVGVGRLPEEVL
jgi:hypothetical protein